MIVGTLVEFCEVFICLRLFLVGVHSVCSVRSLTTHFWSSAFDDASILFDFVLPY